MIDTVVDDFFHEKQIHKGQNSQIEGIRSKDVSQCELGCVEAVDRAKGSHKLWKRCRKGQQHSAHKTSRDADVFKLVPNFSELNSTINDERTSNNKVKG